MIMFALAMALFLGGLILGVAHFSLAYYADVRANQAAMAAVRGGASQVALGALESDVVELQPGSATTQGSALWACTQAGQQVAGAGALVSCTAQGNELTANVSILVSQFGMTETVSASYVGCPVQGYGPTAIVATNCPVT